MKGASLSFESASVQPAARNVNSFSAPFEWRLVVIGLWVFAGYYLGAKIGFALTFKPFPVSVLWPPNSILVAALLLTPPRIWWVVLLAAFPAHCATQLQSHVPPLMILSWFISNSCEAVIGAGLTRYLVGGPIRFRSLRNTGIFCLCVVFIGPFLSSFLDAAFVVWNHWGEGAYWKLIRIRFSSNALAALIVVPLIVTWATNGIRALRTARLSRYLEACVLFLGLFLVSRAVLYEFGGGADSALLFLPLPFLLWAAVRFGSLGASSAISIVGFLAIWSGSHGHGPFSGGTAEQNALSIQIFLIVLAIPILFLATMIEERTTGETELRESETRFRMVADAAPVFIWMSGVDKLCTFLNKPWLEFTGRSLEQEMGNGWVESVHPDDLQRCLKIYTEAFDARKAFVMQYRLRRNDGEYRWISDHGVPRYGAQGNFTGYIGSCVDVTELINKEQALREFEERVVLAAETAHLGVWEMDTATNEIWMSDGARSLFQFETKTRLDHAAVQDRVHPEDRALRDSAVKRAIETRGGYEVEYRVLLPDGTLRWIGARGRCVTGESGAGTRLIGVSIDITPRKLAEAEALQHREELGHLSRVAAMGELSASIAHELNQPLSGITSNASAGQRFIDRGDVDLRELRDLLGDIIADGHRAGDVIRGIQTMVKKGVPARQAVNVNDLVIKVVRMVKPNAMLHSCELGTFLDPNLPTIEGDPVQLQQVLLNLTINAFDAMRDTPLSRRKVVIATEGDADGTTHVSVRDYGVGIPEEARERLFDHFFTTKAKGLGIGLAIVRSIVQSHGGTIMAENADGGGARFYFTLPASAKTSAV
jgi:two-component system, LuxR family, sensor kinase FixL